VVCDGSGSGNQGTGTQLRGSGDGSGLWPNARLMHGLDPSGVCHHLLHLHPSLLVRKDGCRVMGISCCHSAGEVPVQRGEKYLVFDIGSPWKGCIGRVQVPQRARHEPAPRRYPRLCAGEAANNPAQDTGRRNAVRGVEREKETKRSETGFRSKVPRVCLPIGCLRLHRSGHPNSVILVSLPPRREGVPSAWQPAVPQDTPGRWIWDAREGFVCAGRSGVHSGISVVDPTWSTSVATSEGKGDRGSGTCLRGMGSHDHRMQQ
jgi:hypothetical protein